MPKKPPGPADQHADHEEPVLAREGLEAELMDEGSSEAGEEIADAAAVKRAREQPNP
jgi:hypothetical protein